MPKNLKVPPLEKRKKRGLCKFHGFLGHNLSRCTRFRDSVQKALDEGRLKFGDKAKQTNQAEEDPLKTVDSMYAELVGINMVDISEDSMAFETSAPEDSLSANAEKVTKGHHLDAEMVIEDQFAEKMKTTYLEVEEDLVDFLNRCKISNMPCCALDAVQYSIRKLRRLWKDFDHNHTEKIDGWTIIQSMVSTKRASPTR